jgi:DNA repair/transcription protein MET18/MMS19
LQSLQEIADYPFVKIFPHQTEVLEVLEMALDDPKRKVRNEAVYCNQLWFKLGSTTE